MNQRILVVDDDPLIRTLICVSLGTLAEVVEAVDGDQAMALFVDSRFDLVLLDWDMPKMSGLDVLKAIRARDREVPVIMVTAKAEREMVVKAIQAGASDYVVKPFDAETLREKMSHFLKPA